MPAALLERDRRRLPDAERLDRLPTAAPTHWLDAHASSPEPPPHSLSGRADELAARTRDRWEDEPIEAESMREPVPDASRELEPIASITLPASKPRATRETVSLSLLWTEVEGEAEPSPVAEPEVVAEPGAGTDRGER